MHDSHWPRAAPSPASMRRLKPISHPDWRVDPAKALGAAVAREATSRRLLGEQDEVTETAEPLALPAVGKQKFRVATHACSSRSPASRPDRSSWSAIRSPRLFPADARPARRTSDLGALRLCGFDWSLIDKFALTRFGGRRSSAPSSASRRPWTSAKADGRMKRRSVSVGRRMRWRSGDRSPTNPG